MCQSNGMESPAVEGDSPVAEDTENSRGIPSSAGHVKPGAKQGGPSSKAKYYLPTDSEPVP